jgi:hypothetical protein
VGWASLLLSHAPEIWWRLAEVSGTAAADASGNARLGTYTNAPTLGQPGLLNSEPADKAITLNGVNQRAQRANETWMNTNLNCTIGCVVKPSVVPGADGNRREMVGLGGTIQLWAGFAGNGTVTFWIQVPGVGNVDCSTAAVLASGTIYDVIATFDGADMRVYIDGVQQATRARTAGSLTMNSLYGFYAGHASADFSDNTFWKGDIDETFFIKSTLSAAQVLALHNARVAAPNQPPSAPGAFVTPTAGQSFDKFADLEWGAATDVDLDPLQYFGEYSSDGGANWASLFTVQAGLTYHWNTTLKADGSLYMVRVAAYDGANVGAWRTSSAFTIYHNQAPAAPASFTHPLVGEVFEDLVPVAWTPAVDPESDALQYLGEYSVDGGGSWLALFGWQSGASYDWDTSGFPYRVTYKVRVKARDAEPLESGWLTSAAFTIQQTSTPPNAPVVTVAIRTDYSVLVRGSAFADVDPGFEGVHLATQWQLDVAAGDFTVPKIDTLWDEDRLLEAWLTGLPPHTALKVRARYRDAGGTIGSWSAPVAFTSRRVFTLGGPYGFRSKNEGTANDVQGVFGNLSAPTIFVENGWPELTVAAVEGFSSTDLGWRSRVFNYQGMYDQEAPLLASMVRYRDPLDPAVCVCIPQNLDAPAELFGANGQWVVYYRNGLVGLFGSDPSVGNQHWILPSLPLIENEPNLIVLQYRRPTWSVVYFTDGLGHPAATITVTRSEVCTMWVNGVMIGGFLNRTSASHSPNDELLQLGNGGTIDVGHASLNLGSLDIWANGGVFPGIVSEFAYWKNYMVGTDWADALWAAFDARNRTAFDARMAQSPRPDIRDRFSQPQPPSKPRLIVG